MRGQARQSLADDVPDGLWGPRRCERGGGTPAPLCSPRLQRHTPKLAKEERVSAREVVELTRDSRHLGVGQVASAPADELRNVCPRQAVEPQAHHAVGAVQLRERLAKSFADVRVCVPVRR